MSDNRNSRGRKARVVAAYVILIASVIFWPVSALTWARDEPQFILGLSWAAIILSAAELLTSSQIHAENGDDG